MGIVKMLNYGFVHIELWSMLGGSWQIFKSRILVVDSYTGLELREK